MDLALESTRGLISRLWGISTLIKLDDISDAARQRIASEAAPLQQKLDSVGLGAPVQKLILGSSLREEMLTLDALQSRAAAAAAGALNSTELNLTIIQAPNDHPTLGARPGKPPVAVGRVRSEAAAGPVAPMATADDKSNRYFGVAVGSLVTVRSCVGLD